MCWVNTFQKADHAFSHASLSSVFSYFSFPLFLRPSTLTHLWRAGGGGIQMLMRRSERRGGHELNRHGKHAQANGQTYTHHANWRLKAKLGSESSMGKLTVSRERQKNGKRERAMEHIGTLSIEN